MEQARLPYFLAFNSLTRLRFREISAILEHFGQDAGEAWLHPREWAGAARLSSQAEKEILAQHSRVSPEKLYSQLLACGCKVSVWEDEDYPASLRELYSPPLLLFYHGHLPGPEDICLAMIGSRQASAYGRQTAEVFARDLAAQGAVIVSGLARGIDGVCHRAALQASGRTVAVLGSGLDVIYPPEHDRLYADVCTSGAVISEFPLGTEALPFNFPRRNRLISGLSRAVIVVEAGIKSGTLRTVDYALEQGRDVFCIPGNVTSPSSRGTNKLLKEGAADIMTCAEDVWSRYSQAPLLRVRTAPAAKTEDPEEKRLLQALREPKKADELLEAKITGLDAAALLARLSMLELRGLIRQLPGKYYQTVIKNIRG